MKLSDFESAENRLTAAATLASSTSQYRATTLRSYAYEVLGCWHLVGDEPALFVFCPASQTPLGSISDSQKRELGAIVADACRDAA